MDVRKKEFEEKLPVKKVVFEMSGYVVMVALGIVCALLSVITSLCHQNGDADGLYFAGLQGSEFVSLQLEVWITITFFYLFALLFKKYVVGFVLGFIWWTGVTQWQDYLSRLGKQDGGAHLTVERAVWMLLLIAPMNVLMIVHSKYRDLSKGKICCFKALDIVACAGVAVFAGCVACKCLEWGSGWKEGIFLLLAVIAGILFVIKMLEKNVCKLEVASKKSVKRPFLLWEFGV